MTQVGASSLGVEAAVQELSGVKERESLATGEACMSEFAHQRQDSVGHMCSSAHECSKIADWPEMI